MGILGAAHPYRNPCCPSPRSPLPRFGGRAVDRSAASIRTPGRRKRPQPNTHTGPPEAAPNTQTGPPEAAPAQSARPPGPGRARPPGLTREPYFSRKAVAGSASGGPSNAPHCRSLRLGASHNEDFDFSLFSMFFRLFSENGYYPKTYRYLGAGVRQCAIRTGPAPQIVLCFSVFPQTTENRKNMEKHSFPKSLLK